MDDKRVWMTIGPGRQGRMCCGELQVLVRAVAERCIAGVFALTESVAAFLVNHHFHGAELRAFVRAVAPGLGLGVAASAPPVRAALEFEYRRLFVSDMGIHKHVLLFRRFRTARGTHFREGQRLL